MYNDINGRHPYQSSWNALRIIAAIIGTLGCVMCLISTFLPFLSKDIFGYNLDKYMLIQDKVGYIVIALSLFGLIFLLIQRKIPALITTILLSFFAVILFLELEDDSGGLLSSLLRGLVSWGAGCYLFYAGVGFTVVSTVILLFSPSKK